MKAENENLKDDMLSKVIKDNFKEEGLSSNFTYQVMGKIESLEKTPKRKSLFPWWGWVITCGAFAAAIVLAVINAPMPETASQREMEIIQNLQNNYEEFKFYIGIATVVMAVILVDLLFRFRKKMSI